ncbi:hypothetical protein [Streptomyces sp. NPDC047042]|uniref:hypothetical protein n=1 Tax=Streptomyces sp. NPDC047042 TaxID=3154807 RepID=UPI0033F99D05
MESTPEFLLLGVGGGEYTPRFSSAGISRSVSPLIQWDSIDQLAVGFAVTPVRRFLGGVLYLAASAGLATGSSLAAKESRMWIHLKSGQRLSWWFDVDFSKRSGMWHQKIIEDLFDILSERIRLSLLGHPDKCASLLKGLSEVRAFPPRRRKQQIIALLEGIDPISG